MASIKSRSHTNLILKGFYNVYNDLGNGFLESVYENALAFTLSEYGLKIEKQKEIQVSYRKHIVGKFRADIIVDDIIILELKTAKTIDAIYIAQLMNYLKASDIEIGLLLNFGIKPQFKRLIFNR